MRLSLYFPIVFPLSSYSQSARGVGAYRQLFLAGDVVILNTNWNFIKRIIYD